jgi:hypothetical protein
VIEPRIPKLGNYPDLPAWALNTITDFLRGRRQGELTIRREKGAENPCREGSENAYCWLGGWGKGPPAKACRESSHCRSKKQQGDRLSPSAS